jgi:nicotinamidase-related amidase
VLDLIRVNAYLGVAVGMHDTHLQFEQSPTSLHFCPFMLIDDQESQLVLVDYQERLLPAIFEAESVLLNAKRLAQAAQWMEVPVWGTEQNPEKLGAMPDGVRQFCRSVLPKMSFSACADGLMELLKPPTRNTQAGNARSLPKHLQKKPELEATRQTIILGGVEAHICLLQTALDLIEQEFEVYIVTDACSSRTERNRDAAFDRLAGMGAELVTTEMVLFEWLRSAESDAFREIQALIK